MRTRDDARQTKEKGDKQKNRYKQDRMFLSRPHTICTVEIGFGRTQGCTVDGGTITGEPANLK
jgi:hypothetical protein